jgi:glucokinase
MSLLGIDLGGTKLGITQFSLEGAVLHTRSIPLAGRSGKDVGLLITDSIVSILKSKQYDEPVLSIGISVPGISRNHTGTVWAPNIPGWDDYPLLQEVKALSGKIPVTIESDRACSILGETWKGKANGCKDAIFLAVGTGIGAGIMVNGAILRGAHDISGAVGWMALTRPFNDIYKSCGCFEYYASGEGIARVAKDLLQQEVTYEGELRNKPVEEITSHDIFAAFEMNDALSREVFNICIEFWGMAIANLVSIFNPEKIIFGGGVFGPAIQFIPAIKSEALKWAQPISIHQVSLEASALGSEAAVYGAAYMALKAIHR